MEFDHVLDAWVISRYADVVAAFREVRLRPVGARNQKNAKLPDQAAQEQMRAEALLLFSAAKMAEWKISFESEARRIIGSLPAGHPVDIVREFAGPWCLRAAEIVTGAESFRRNCLAALAREVSAGAAEPFDNDLREKASLASAELERYFEGPAAPMLSATFVALARTLACLLANGWLALVRHPVQLAILRSHPHLMAGAVEEMLRYAAIPRIIFRQACQSFDLRGVRIEESQRVILMLASANRDPERFPEPERFDCERRASAQVSLGFGPHSCIGASLIRMAALAATRAFVGHFAEANLCNPIEWVGGSGFHSPTAFYLY